MYFPFLLNFRVSEKSVHIYEGCSSEKNFTKGCVPTTKLF